jgi:hypothetical protein
MLKSFTVNQEAALPRVGSIRYKRDAILAALTGGGVGSVGDTLSSAVLSQAAAEEKIVVPAVSSMPHFQQQIPSLQNDGRRHSVSSVGSLTLPVAAAGGGMVGIPNVAFVEHVTIQMNSPNLPTVEGNMPEFYESLPSQAAEHTQEEWPAIPYIDPRTGVPHQGIRTAPFTRPIRKESLTELSSATLLPPGSASAPNFAAPTQRNRVPAPFKIDTSLNGRSEIRSSATYPNTPTGSSLHSATTVLSSTSSRKSQHASFDAALKELDGLMGELQDQIKTAELDDTEQSLQYNGPPQPLIPSSSSSTVTGQPQYSASSDYTETTASRNPPPLPIPPRRGSLLIPSQTISASIPPQVQNALSHSFAYDFTFMTPPTTPPRQALSLVPESIDSQHPSPSKTPSPQKQAHTPPQRYSQDQLNQQQQQSNQDIPQSPVSPRQRPSSVQSSPLGHSKSQSHPLKNRRLSASSTGTSGTGSRSSVLSHPSSDKVTSPNSLVNYLSHVGGGIGVGIGMGAGGSGGGDSAVVVESELNLSTHTGKESRRTSQSSLEGGDRDAELEDSISEEMEGVGLFEGAAAGGGLGAQKLSTSSLDREVGKMRRLSRSSLGSRRSIMLSTVDEDDQLSTNQKSPVEGVESDREPNTPEDFHVNLSQRQSYFPSPGDFLPQRKDAEVAEQAQPLHELSEVPNSFMMSDTKNGPDTSFGTESTVSSVMDESRMALLKELLETMSEEEMMMMMKNLGSKSKGKEKVAA